jgi:uncharacterized protein (TIGR02145 family)
MRPMAANFSLTGSELLINDKTTLSVIPPAEPDSGISYTWTIPAGFTVTTGSTITESVTIQAPGQAQANAVPITLTAKAVNYCTATYTENVTVENCYSLPSLPNITSNIQAVDGIVTVSSRQNVTFSTPVITPRQTGGTATYNWNFYSNTLPFTPSSSTGSNSFATTAPAYNASTYTLALQVKADGYCDPDPVTQKVTIAAYTAPLRGQIFLKEAMRTTDPSYNNQDSTIWIAQDQPATLTATYIPAAGENGYELKWYWKWIDNNSNSQSLTGHTNIIGFTPTQEVNDRWLIVEVEDVHGKAPISKTYHYTVQPCGYNKPDLYININYPCGKTTGAQNDKAFIRDPADNKIYPVVKIQGRWWFADNLKKETGSHVSPASLGLAPELGIYYLAGSAGICPAGWELPDSPDWNQLIKIEEGSAANQFQYLIINRLSEEPYDGTAWAKYQNAIQAADYYGFSAKPTGYIPNNALSIQGLRAYFLPKTGVNIYYLGINDISNPVTSSAGILGTTSIATNSYYTARCVRSE